MNTFQQTRIRIKSEVNQQIFRVVTKVGGGGMRLRESVRVGVHDSVSMCVCLCVCEREREREREREM